MTCNHPASQLIGTHQGVTCRACGKVFTPEEYRAHIHPPDAEKASPKQRPRRKKEANAQ